MKKNGILDKLVFALLLLVSIVAFNNMTNVYGQNEIGGIETESEIIITARIPTSNK
jgi:hypothetical protein